MALFLLMASASRSRAQQHLPANIDLSATETIAPAAASEASPVGEFYSAQNPDEAAIPGNFSGLPVWDLGSGSYLLDDLPGDTRANGVPNGGMRPDDSPPSPGGGPGGGTNYPPPFSYTIPTNGLWLEMTGVTNGIVGVNLNNATDYVYEIFSATNLPTSQWTIEEEVFPGANQAVCPFTVPTSGRDNLFLWARDWTGITENGNTVPEWWFWEYFGTTALSGSNLDSQGYTLLYDYQNGQNPNPIGFSLAPTNQYVNTVYPSIPISLQSGAPSSMSALVDDTNFSAATWMPYNSNIVVNLGSTQGWHTAYVGLRGSPNAPPTWNAILLNLDWTPPALVLTNPAPGVVTAPMIQLQGYSPEELASVSYSLSNFLGSWSDQPGYVTSRQLDTNAFGSEGDGFHASTFHWPMERTS